MAFFIVLTILVLDQASKFFFIRFLALNQSIPIVPGIFHFTLVHNRGAAFGILRGQVFLFILTSLIAVILIYQNLKNNRKENPLLFNISLALILAGGLGNLIDRIFFGYVIDFLDFRIWPVFNVADSAITAGAVLLGWTILKRKV